MLVEVTAEDIAKGKPHDPYICPIGLAVARTIGVDLTKYIRNEMRDKIPFAVFGRRVRFGESIWFAPARVNEFIYAYENLQDVEPFTFDIPQEVLAKGGL